MLKHRGFCTDTCGDTRGTESLFDTACAGGEGYYHIRRIYDRYHELWYQYHTAITLFRV
jgi:hypothetical protein